MPNWAINGSSQNGKDGAMPSRRHFLASAAATLAAPYVVHDSAFGANDRIGVGAIGVGGRGGGHVNSFLRRSETQVVAVCDPYRSKRQGARQAAERTYATRAAKGSYKGCGDYADFRELVARDDIDAVVIASPEFWHAHHSVWAMRSGKDVYCEKAMTLTVAEGQAVVAAARRHGRIFQLGTQQRSSRNFRFACELARNGYLGKVNTVEVGVPGGRALANVPPEKPPPDIDYEMWLGPSPWTPYNKLKCSYNWYFIYDYCIGWIGSWGVHHVDIAQWGMPTLRTKPLEIDGTATFPTDGIANTSVTWHIHYRTPDGLHFSFGDNRRHPQGCRFIGDKGWVHVNRGGIRSDPPSLLKTQLKPDDEHIYASHDHHGNFIDCIRSRRDPVANVEEGHSATVLTILGDIASRLARKLTWDWKTQTFVNDPEANRLLSRPMRSPWAL